MIAELGTSHTYVVGRRNRAGYPYRRRLARRRLSPWTRAITGSRKYSPGENWNPQTRSPLTEPGLKVKEGNYLIAVNGVPAPATSNVYSYFQGLAAQTVTLKVNDKPSAVGAWEIVRSANRAMKASSLPRLGRIAPQNCGASHRRPYWLHARAGY